MEAVTNKPKPDGMFCWPTFSTMYDLIRLLNLVSRVNVTLNRLSYLLFGPLHLRLGLHCGERGLHGGKIAVSSK